MNDPFEFPAALGFVEFGESSFEFLVREFDFALVESKSTALRFQRGAMVVTVYHEPLSYMLGFHFCHEGVDARRKLDGAEILGKKCEGRNPLSPFMSPNTRDKVEWCVNRLAGLMREHCEDLLMGDQVAWAELAKPLPYQPPRMSEDPCHGPDRRAAHAAWMAKDLAEVIRLLEPIEDKILESEKRRLAFSRKRAK